MILTAEEYSRGFLDFDADIPEGCSIEVWARSADQPGDEGEWTGPYVKPQGSKVLCPKKPYMQLNIHLRRGDDPTNTPVIRKVRWERDGETYLWPGKEGFVGPPGALILGRDYGCSYRLILRPKKAVWVEPVVIIDKLIRVRLWKGGIKAYRIVESQDGIADSDKTYLVGGTFEETTTEGDVIEILVTVPTTDKDQGKLAARIQVESIAGLLALSLGEHIIGETVFTDCFFSDATSEEAELLFPPQSLEILSVNQDFASHVEYAMSEFYESPIRSAVGLALRWYAKGLESESSDDKFIAFFVGLETLASGFFATLDPKPIRKEYAQFQEYLSSSQSQMPSSLQDVILGRLADFPLNMKFQTYWKDRFHKKTRLSQEFTNLNRIRSEILHGSARIVNVEQVNSAKKLLEKGLARELGLEDMIDYRRKRPRILEAGFRFSLRQPGNKTASE